MFHDLIRQTLAIDPTCRPSCQQVQVHLGEVGVLNSWDLEAAIDFEVQARTPVMEEPLVSPADPNPPSTASSSAATASATATHLISSFRGGAGSVFGKIKESSKAVVSSLLAPKDLDFHLLTGKIAAMSYPSDGIDLVYKNQVKCDR